MFISSNDILAVGFFIPSFVTIICMPYDKTIVSTVYYSNAIVCLSSAPAFGLVTHSLLSSERR